MQDRGGLWKGTLLALWRGILLLWLFVHSTGVSAQSGLNTYGMPGLVDMPLAFPLPDAQLAGTISYFDQTTRSTLAFQVTPRITAAFRYAGLEGLGGSLRDTLFDRSFDAQVLLAKERRRRPALALGFRDFIGTGVYSGEYIVASKSAGRFSVTGGVGWGRLGRGGYAARSQSTASTTQGGQLEATRWFSGDPALFGGVTWSPSERLRFAVEYSSDSYLQESADGVLERRSQVNLGVDWRLSETATVKAFFLHGDKVGLALHVQGNPARSRTPSGSHAGPVPVRYRGTPYDADGWQARLRTALAGDGLDMVGVVPRGDYLRLDVRNARYGASAEAIGRAARHLSRAAPDEVEVFQIVPVEAGMRAAMITVRRADIERLVHDVDGAEKFWDAATVSEAPSAGVPTGHTGQFPRVSWGFGPYARASFFDPDRPIMADFGVRLSAEVAFSHRLFLSGSVRKSVGGNFGDSDRASDSVLPKVRSEANRYLSAGDPALETLSLAYYFRPGRNLYGRVSVGYLEAHFGGVSTEVLWKPVHSAFALGAEVNFVRQRAFDQTFGFRSYDVVTGHVSGYYAFENGFHAQLDVGRYLAGDWGATLAVDREFRNGWRIGAYATFTDVSFEDFGEGSFDKGLRFTIPLEPFLGQPTRRKFGVTLQPLTRDGGARLRVDGRLYEQVRAFHARGLKATWGRVWR